MPSILPQRLSNIVRSTCWVSSLFVWGVGWGMFQNASPALAQEASVPWECSEYSGEAQTRCMNTLLEIQQKKIAELEQQLQAQEGTVNELKEKMARQETLARREAQARQQDPRYPPPPYVPAYSYPYGYSYGFAPLAPPLGIYVQPPWRVPRYYGYGPGYWRQPGLSFNFRFGKGHKYRRR